MNGPPGAAKGKEGACVEGGKSRQWKKRGGEEKG